MAKKRKPRSKPKSTPAVKPHTPRPRHAMTAGDAVVWPSGVQQRYGITHVTRWRWERDGKLPPRDIQVGGRSGWRPETLAAYESASLQPAS